MTDELVVRHQGEEVGRIRQNTDGGLVFTYAEAWLTSGFALARGLPLVTGPQPTDYFANLLPEDRARSRIAKRVGISAGNDFAFLALFGRDCAASLEIAPVDDDAKPAPSDEGIWFLNDDDGIQLSTKTGFADFFAEERVRLSLAGAQNKLAVVVDDDGRVGVPLDGRPSTHILKLPNPDYKGLVENEAVMLDMARRLGLDVVHHSIVTLGKTRLLLIERYDRRRAGGQVTRLHQQDLCQALGLPPDLKYEAEGGPSLADVFNLVRDEVDDPLDAAQQLLSWVAFNVVAHNADAHAKNVSLVRDDEGGQRMAPFYDLVCTGAYDLDHRMAMAVGGQADPGYIGTKQWAQFASDVGVGKALVTRVATTMADGLMGAFSDAAAAFEEEVGRIPRRAQLEKVLRKRARKTLQLLA